MSEYDTKSCNALEKPFYRPVEAALRWCGLIDYEVKILSETNDGIDLPRVGKFPQWPCLRANTEKILDAISYGNIPRGRDGKTISADEQVRGDRVTVRHTDLREWMAKYYPDQKPTFLFDEIERYSHSAINADSFRALHADRDALKARIDKSVIEYTKLNDAHKEIVRERDKLKQNAASVTTTERNTLLTIIAALCEDDGIGHQDRGAAKRIAELTESIGTPVSEDTVKRHLDKIPEALESRMK